MANYGPYISKITLPSGTTYDIKDAEARELIAAIQSGGLSFKISSAAADTPLGVSWTQKTSSSDPGTTITGTLPAGDGSTPGSVNTKPYIYLVPHVKTGTSVDYYREYVTINFGTESAPNYAWEYLGNTDIDLSGLGALAYKDSATGNVTVNETTGATFTNGSVTGSAAYTPSGTVCSMMGPGDVAVSTTYTPAGSVTGSVQFTPTNKLTVKGSYTPSGSVTGSVDLGGIPAVGNTSGNLGVTGNVDITNIWASGSYKPAGTVGAPTITVTPSTNVIAEPISFGNVTAGTAASLTMSASTVSTDATFETLVISWTPDTPTAVTLPTFSSCTVVTGIASANATAPSFTGTDATVVVKSTGRGTTSTSTVSTSGLLSGAATTGSLGVTVMTNSMVSVPISAGFTGSSATITSETTSGTSVGITAAFTGSSATITASNTADIAVTSTFNGTAANIAVNGTATGTVTTTSQAVSKTVTVS